MKNATVLTQMAELFVRKRDALSVNFKEIVQNTVKLPKKIKAMEERRARGSNETKLQRFITPGA